ncbi:MAG: hypothetical protein ACYDCO_11770 [Armatimonadota bacterium]
MHTLWNPADRAAMLARVERIEVDRQACWGAMCAAQMLAHLIESFKIAFAEKPVRVIPGVQPAPEDRRRIIFGEQPWPQGVVKAPPEYLAGAFDPLRLDAYQRTLAEYLQRFTASPETLRWGKHAVLDELTPDEWGTLCWKHMDHHLRQFGA